MPSYTQRAHQAAERLSSLRVEAPPALDPVAMFRVAIGYEPDPWQAELLKSDARRVLLCCSRQSGKSSTCALLGLYTAMAQPGSLVLILSPSLRQSGELFRKIVSAYLALGQPVRSTSVTATTLELSNMSRVVSLPGQEATVRGFSGVSTLIVDEAARVPDELIYSVRPMLAVSGGRLICLSTPWGRRGWYWQSWESAEPWLRIKVTALDVPRISADFLAEEERIMPRLFFQSEYLCQFVDSVDQVFLSEDVEAALSDDVLPLFGEDGNVLRRM